MRRPWRDNLLLAEFALIVLLQMWLLSAAFARSAPIVAAGRQFACTPTRVWDGDGPIWCREGPHLRLAGIAARELDGHCRPGHPCPRASGIAARDQLVHLLGGSLGRTRDGHIRVRGTTLSCRSNGPDKYNRTLATCRSNGRDLGRQLIAAGVAAPWRFRE